MAMTMSDNMSASNDWFQFYQQQQQDFHGGVPSSSISDATAVTTVVSTAGVTASSPPLPPNMLNSTSSASTSTTHHNISPEGRVAKPVRRRTRASRRTPTTLLNTDTTNFRAMVQQFTGGPTAPFAPTPSASSGLASLGFGFGFGPRQAHIGPTGLMMGPPPTGYHLQQQQQPQPQMFQQQNLAFHSSNTEAGDHQSRFLQRLNSNSNNNSNNNNHPRASNNATDLGIGGFVMDHGSLGRFFPSNS